MLTAARGAWLVALLALLVGFGDAQSQEPPAGQSPPSGRSSSPAPDQRGTDQLPLTVKALPDPDAKEKAEKDEHERKEKSIVDQKLAFETQRLADYTDQLALFTLFLVGVAVVQDAFGQTRRTRFCYDISSGRTRIAGSRAYNAFGPDDEIKT